MTLYKLLHKYYSTGIDGWWTQNPKSKWIITR